MQSTYYFITSSRTQIGIFRAKFLICNGSYNFCLQKRDFPITVKLGDKERFDKEQIGVKELFTDYQPFFYHKSTVR